MDESTTEFAIATEDRGRVRIVTLDRPDKLNCFTPAGYDRLARSLAEADADDGVAVCVLTGSGRAFSSGVDLSVMDRPDGGAELARNFDPLVEQLARFTKPLLAAVNGLAVGFGATVLLHCDLVVVDERAEIRMPFVSLGTGAEAASSWLLPRRVGMQQASWLILSGRGLTAEEAVATGFAFAIAPAGHALDETLVHAAEIAEHKTEALVANKRLLRAGWAEAIAETWDRERAAMSDLAEKIGPIGRKQSADVMADFHHVAEEYDRIGSQYQESKLLPFRLHVEEHTTFGLLPDLAGCSVVDLACGDGIYSRKLMRRGAARVLGVDISPEMIALATRAEESVPLGVHYVLADVAALDLDERFDIAFCSYLFNYAATRAELRSLIRAVGRLVRPGGLVVGSNDYPDNPPDCYDRYRPYGFVKVGAHDRHEGTAITYRFFNPDGTAFELDNYYLPTEAYETEFAAAGFASFHWVLPEVSPEGQAAFAPGYWDTYLQAPPIVSFVATAGTG